MIDNIKLLIGITDDSQDSLLELLTESVSARLKLLISMDEVPSELNHIVAEVCVARFNRIGSEGATSHSVEGESISFESDFAAYMPEIKAYIASNADIKRGKVRFI